MNLQSTVGGVGLFTSVFSEVLITAPEPFKHQQWQAVPIRHTKHPRAGFLGGEGGRSFVSLAISASTRNFLMMGTDVGA
jgi:hypothetical protein